MDVNAARLRPLNEAAKQQGLAHVIQTKVRQLLTHPEPPGSSSLKWDSSDSVSNNIYFAFVTCLKQRFR